MEKTLFNQLKKEVSYNNLKSLTDTNISELTLLQAKQVEDLLLDVELDENGNKILDQIVNHLENLVQVKKVANKKANAVKKAPVKETPVKEVPTKEEVKTEEVKAPSKVDKSAKKNAPKKEEVKALEVVKEVKKEDTKEVKSNKDSKISNALKVGQVIQFRVEDEEIQHNITIVHIGKYNVIGVMESDEREVFNIRKGDINKGIFAYKDRHNEEYNIIVTL